MVLGLQLHDEPRPHGPEHKCGHTPTPHVLWTMRVIRRCSAEEREKRNIAENPGSLIDANKISRVLSDIATAGKTVKDALSKAWQSLSKLKIFHRKNKKLLLSSGDGATVTRNGARDRFDSRRSLRELVQKCAFDCCPPSCG
ncbi:hypothetical protein V5799_029400 [Amblyomma americanum]|uniref:Uncharacterized protein n=1 Tax=Amblyomma americanum TaxID=6943 RepID=A0AAQ4ERF4_AMBAM